MDELVKRLHRYSENCVAYKLDADFADAVQQAADAIKELSRKYIEERNAAVELTGELASKPRWIPVTERLPKDREMVIGFTPCDGFMFVGYHVTSIYHDRDFSYWNIVTAMRSTRKMIKKVTHWMPLPQPPKEE